MNNDFEYILLKKLLCNSEYYGKVMPILKSKYFKELGNKETFKLIKEYYTQYSSIPELVDLRAKVKNVPNSEIRKEIKDSLTKLSETEESKNLKFLLDETVSWVKHSLFIEALQVGADGAMNNDDNLILKSQQILEERAKISIDSYLGLDFDDIDTMIEYYSERNIGILTQHKSLNLRLGPGFLPGTLSVILAAQGIGKSLMMTDIISGIIKKSKNILLVSLEMADKEIMKRVHANAMDLPINSLIDLSKTEGELKEKQEKGGTVVLKEDIIDAYNKLKLSGKCGKLFVKDYPSGEFSALMLEQLVESFKLEKGIEFDIIFIDYLGIMKSDRLPYSVGLYSYVKSIGEEVRAVAKKLNVSIISASQLNREAINSDNADNSKISDSIGTAMTADFMMFLLQTEDMKEKCEIVCKVTKNRFNGKTDHWTMNIQYEHMRFNDMIIIDPTKKIETVDVVTGEVKQETAKIDDDFGIITAEKYEKAGKIASEQIRNVYNNDMEIIKKTDERNGLNPSETVDPFKDEMLDLFKNLGVEF